MKETRISENEYNKPNLYKRPDSRWWWYSWYIEGKQKRKSCKKIGLLIDKHTKEEAIGILNNYLGLIDSIDLEKSLLDLSNKIILTPAQEIDYLCNKRNIYFSKYLKEKRKTNIKYRLNGNISSAISFSLNGNKKGCHWENLVGYTLNKLKRHLEKQFTKGMSWDNYGEWEIDHKIPISAFNFDSPEHLDFKRCWALSNLQPMWGTENRIKGYKLKIAFQPSLKL